MTVCTAAVVKLYIKIIQVIRTSTIYTVCICIHIAAYFHRTHNYRHVPKSVSQFLMVQHVPFSAYHFLKFDRQIPISAYWSMFSYIFFYFWVAQVPFGGTASSRTYSCESSSRIRVQQVFPFLDMGTNYTDMATSECSSSCNSFFFSLIVGLVLSLSIKQHPHVWMECQEIDRERK